MFLILVQYRDNHMLKRRPDGEVQPGIKWGPFTMRIPLHSFAFFIVRHAYKGSQSLGPQDWPWCRISWLYWGWSFEEAVTMAMFHSMLISFSWMFFGDPYAPGWLTPAIPFVVAFITAPAYMGDHASQFQAMTALSLNFAFILIVLGVTGLGAKIIKIVPNVFKGGIILGAAIAAFLRVTKDGDAANVFQSAPIAGTLGVVIICLVFAFSKPLQALAINKRWLATILGFGLLPGFVIAGSVGYFTGEFRYNIRWEILDVGASSSFVMGKSVAFRDRLATHRNLSSFVPLGANHLYFVFW